MFFQRWILAPRDPVPLYLTERLPNTSRRVSPTRMPELQPTDADSLRAFHHLAADVRSLSQGIAASAGEPRLVRGYVETSEVLETYRPLCVRVRRVCTESDRTSLVQTCRIVIASGSEPVGRRTEEVVARYQRVEEDLRSYTTLNNRQVNHRDVFEAWLDAAIFGAFDASDSSYRSLFDECGKAVEGIAVRITESVSRCVLDLDELVSEVLAADTPHQV